MHFHASAIAAFAALAQFAGIANAYLYNPELGTPPCSEITNSNLVNFDNLNCEASIAALDACKGMCIAQSNGCNWASCMYHVQYSTTDCANAASNNWDNSQQDYACGHAAAANRPACANC